MHGSDPPLSQVSGGGMGMFSVECGEAGPVVSIGVGDGSGEGPRTAKRVSRHCLDSP